MSRYPKLYDGEVFLIDTAEETLRLACCDCGLVHDVVVRVVVDEDPQPGGVVGMALYRNNRSTGQLRRHRYGNLQHQGLQLTDR